MATLQTKLGKVAKRMKDSTLRSEKSIAYTAFAVGGYSNLLPLLNKLKVPYRAIDGETKMAERSTLIQTYNTNEVRNFVISTAGNVGINLFCTNHIHIIDTAPNMKDIDQAIGRGLRKKSHWGQKVVGREAACDLPASPDNATVTVHYWLAVPNIDKAKEIIDDYTTNPSKWTLTQDEKTGSMIIEDNEHVKDFFKLMGLNNNKDKSTSRQWKDVWQYITAHRTRSN